MTPRCLTRLAPLALLAAPSAAFASNPLEYPDNGSAAFSRGGAWLAVGNEPIATHYSPAALSTQPSGFAVEQQLAFPHTCFDRRGPGNSRVGPSDTGRRVDEYREVCSARGGFPNTIPSLSIVWRASARLGLGVSIVPPATYGTAQGQFPIRARGFDTGKGQAKLMPAPYRYLQLEQQSTILFPTVAVGYEVAKALRIGVGFVSGIGVINLSTMGVTHLGSNDGKGDHATEDSLSTLRTEDLFVPGVVVSLHGSLGPMFDVAVWGRYLDSIRTSHGSLDVTQQPFDSSGRLNPPCQGARGPDGEIGYARCSANQSVPNHFPRAVTLFEYPIPPEIRAGIRFHLPRTREGVLKPGAGDHAVRDPLRDDVFDVEVDGSFSNNAAADVIRVRFPATKEGQGALTTKPTRVTVPPNADRPTGYMDSYGVRVGGQWNVLPELLALRAGGWMETRSQDPAFLTVAPVGAARFGFGGGVVVRYHFLDVSVGYQRHLSEGLDNRGNGRLRAPAALGANSIPFDLSTDPPGVSAADRQTFRTIHAINGGNVTFDAHVFTLGAVARL